MAESSERSYLIFIWKEGNGHLGHLGDHTTPNNRSVTATCALYNASSYKLCGPVFHGQCIIISTLLSWARPTPRRSFNSLIITSLPITLSSSTIESLKSFQSLARRQNFLYRCKLSSTMRLLRVWRLLLLSMGSSALATT